MLSLSLSTLLACFWPTSYVDGQYVVGLGDRSPKALAVYVWLYCIFWWFVQDAAKVVLYWWLEKYNIFGINDSLMINVAKSVRRGSYSEAQKNPLLGDEESGAHLKEKLLSSH